MTASYRPLIGIVLLVLSTWALSMQEASGKWLMEHSLPLFLLILFRYAVHVVLVLAMTWPKQGVHVFRSKNYPMQIIRGSTSLFAALTVFMALSYLPQAEATAIYFLAPLLVLCLAPWFLEEPSRWHRWVAALVGFIGVMVIVRPGAGLHPVGVIYGLLSAGVIAAQFLCTRKLAVDHSMTTLLWTGIVGLFGALVLVPWQWSEGLAVLRSFEWWQWLLLLNTGVFGTVGHLLQIKAYQHAPASLLAPFSYLQIIAAAGLGLVIWGQFPDVWGWLGIFIVCASGIVVTIIEWRNNQRVKHLVRSMI
ncbi:MAG: DMT family transporter [Alcaligenaceae bacterium]|nr:DMT family transporter [Alcaligenaceae bacterium]